VLHKQGFRVVVPDRVGFGRSSKPIIPYTLSDMAMNTRALLERVGVQKAAIVGHSMGGMVATRFALLDSRHRPRAARAVARHLSPRAADVPRVVTERATRR
jgi:pimeloyl-ACP methyl ester carboxylesterase